MTEATREPRQHRPVQENLVLTALPGEVFDKVLAFVDVPSLAQWDGCSHACRRSSQRAWQVRGVSATSFAKVDLEECYPSRKDQAILEYRAKTYCRRMEALSRRCSTIHSATLSSEFQSRPLEEPAHFIFFVRLTNCQAKDSLNSCPDDFSGSSDVFWEGFVNAVDQGASLNDSTILFFHMREITRQIRWDDDFEKLLSSSQDGDIQETKLPQLFTLTIAAIPKRGLAASLVSSVVAANTGLSSIAQENRSYFYVKAREFSGNDSNQHSTTVFPRLVFTTAVTGQPSQLLGIRLVGDHGQQQN